MRRHPLRSCTWLVPLGLVLAVASCSSPTEIGGYTVTYRVNTTGVATIDSLKYDNGTGTLVKVTSPSVTYAVSLTVATGTTVEAHLYGLGTAAGTTAKLVVVWMTATGTLAGDSTSATTTATNHFTMDLAKRTL